MMSGADDARSHRGGWEERDGMTCQGWWRLWLALAVMPLGCAGSTLKPHDAMPVFVGGQVGGAASAPGTMPHEGVLAHGEIESHGARSTLTLRLANHGRVRIP